MTDFLAHQGGWDELMWFTIPVVLAVLWVRWAEKRARARRAGRPSEPEEVVTNMPDDAQS